MSWAQIEAKQGETVNHYVHSFGNRDASTKLKPSTWASPTEITAVIRSQPNATSIIPAGISETETILLMTNTSIAKRDRFSWDSKYWEALSVDKVFFKGELQYYKSICVRLIEWSPPA